MPWIDKKNKQIRSISGEVVATFKKYKDEKTWKYASKSAPKNRRIKPN